MRTRRKIPAGRLFWPCPPFCQFSASVQWRKCNYRECDRWAEMCIKILFPSNVTVERFRFDFMRFDSIRVESTPYIRVWRAIELYKPYLLLSRSPPTRSFATSTCTSRVRLAAAACTRSALRITAVRDPWRTCTALSNRSAARF